ncbi:MAG: hypothetical protein IPG45_30465 [Deltaproteobacteria bacterium]|nr:hypothetical protein [Deltaproteobacteria bacterium]
MTIETPNGPTRLLCAMRGSAVPGDLPRIKAQLAEVIDSIARSETGKRGPLPAVHPAIVVRSATDRLKVVCAEEGVSLLDLAGTIQISAGPVFVAIEGRQERPRRLRQVFRGKAARVSRVIACWSGDHFSIRDVAAECGASFGLAQSVVGELEAEGFVHRRSPKSGYHVRDRPALIRRWMESAEPAAAVIKPFYAPSTRPEALARAFKAASQRDLPCAFTLAAALLPKELHVAGLPFGLYSGGDQGAVIDALGLRETPPHNFLLMVPHSIQESATGGVFYKLRDLPHGRGVCLPQLAVDCALQGGRAREQAARIVAQIAASEAEVE